MSCLLGCFEPHTRSLSFPFFHETRFLILFAQVDAVTNKGYVDLENYGSGKREKKDVIYDDDLTEEQFCRVR